MVTPSSAHPDEMKTPDPNLLIDIDFDPPCVVNDKREVGERRPRDSEIYLFIFNSKTIINMQKLLMERLKQSYDFSYQLGLVVSLGLSPPCGPAFKVDFKRV
jgi:hypothetical protein